MQSVFRSMPSMPWSANISLNKAVSPFVAHADLSVAGNATNGKRKRNTDSSPRASPAPAPKKLKSAATEIGGAVRTAPKQYIRGTDGNATTKSAVMSVLAPKPVDVVQYSAGSPSAHVHGKADSAGRLPTSSLWQGQFFGPTSQTFATGSAATTKKAERAAFQAQREASLPSATPDVTASTAAQSANVPASLATGQANGVESVTTDETGTQPDASVSRATSGQATVAAGVDVTSGSHKTTSASNTDPAQETSQSVSRANVNMDHVRAICELEINQAILTKHNELRLIDQEIAKCQIALEQIRRCELIPFPAAQGYSPELAMHSGPSLLAPPGHIAAPYPAPWGVTDGPYTQHYAPWLVSSGQFDPRLPYAATPLASPFPRDGRVSRGHGSESTPVSATFQSARAARASVGRGRHSLDTHSSQPQRDPLVIKRNQDNQWVKLYCTNCKPERSDFANVQGFLNHCRISHKLDYKSHEAAAIACGRVVQLSESQLPPEPVSARDAAPKHSFTASTPVEQPSRSSIHPFIFGSLKDREDKHATQQLLPRAQNDNGRSVTGLSTPLTPTLPAGFKSSTSTPHLSHLMAKHGFAGDFAAQVELARRRENLSVYDDSDSDETVENAKKSKVNKKKGNATPASGIKIKLKPGPKPGKRSNGGCVTPSLESSSQFSLQKSFQLDSPGSAGSTVATPSLDMSLSPHAVDSNPGLVSDRDDDDDEMDYEEIPSNNDSVRASAAEMLVKIEDSDGEPGHADETQRLCTVTSTTAC